MKYLKWKARKVFASPWIVVPVVVVITSALVIKSYFMHRGKEQESPLIDIGDEITYRNIYVKAGNCMGKVVDKVDKSIFLIERKDTPEKSLVDIIDILSVNGAQLIIGH